MSVSVIKEGDQVILKKDNSLKAVHICKSKKIGFDRLHFVLDNAVGEPLGSVFEIKEGKLQKINEEDDFDDLLSVQTAVDGDAGSHLLLADGSSQKLSRDDIMTMKAEGVKGKDIVDQLVENSATFKDRTEFSQAKYKNKKRKKHTTRISILKPTTRLIAEMYYHAKGSSKICELRLDSLAQILTMANVRASSRLIVVESCQGLVLGAVMERMGGYGSVVQVYSGDFPARFALDYYNFPDSMLQMVCGLPLNRVNTVGTTEDLSEQPESRSNDKEEEEKDAAENLNEEMLDQKELEKVERREHRLNEELKARQELEKGDMDGLIIVSKFQPSSILLALLPFVSPSRPFVVYSQYKEPLMECYTHLRERGGAVNINVTETWWRHYQVLPSRTHPEVTMNSSGGYLLTGITVHQGTEKARNKPADNSEPQAKKIKAESST